MSTAKKADKTKDSEISSLFVANLELFFEMEKNSKLLTAEERKLKWKITQDYTDGLVDNGGVSTNVFKAIMGVDATKEFPVESREQQTRKLLNQLFIIYS